MLADVRKHPTHYSALALLFSVSLVCYLIAYPAVLLQMVVVMIAAGGYMVWGILHHMAIGDYTHEIMLEYLSISLLTIIMIWSFLFYI